jgi:hypothetical protein
MLKGNVKPIRDEPIDPNKSVSAAIIEAAKRTDDSNKALILAVKDIMMTAPQVHVAAPQVRVQLPANAKPTKWVFSVQRDENGLMTSITAEAK